MLFFGKHYLSSSEINTGVQFISKYLCTASDFSILEYGGMYGQVTHACGKKFLMLSADVRIMRILYSLNI
jgi:hypothetical protein